MRRRVAGEVGLTTPDEDRLALGEKAALALAITVGLTLLAFVLPAVLFLLVELIRGVSGR